MTKKSERIGIAVNNQSVIELVIDRPEYPQQVGSIYLGKVQTIDKGLQAAFVEISGDKLAYLEKKEIPTPHDHQKKPIESLITEGQVIIVQVIKDAYKEKGARLTQNITLGHTGLVYMPKAGYVAISKKIDDSRKDALKEHVKGMLENEEGAIIRTQASRYSDDELQVQIEHLRVLWKRIEKSAKQKNAKSVLYEDDPVCDRFIRRFPPHQITSIYCDDARKVSMIKEKQPQLKEKVGLLTDGEKRLPQTVDQIYNELINSKITGEHGVTINIESTEALIAIDVNSSGFTGKRRSHHFAYEVNLVAARLLMRQIRLRNLSGMIVVDFIRMKDKKDQSKLENKLKQLASEDLTRVDVFGFTALGLFEMTRKREAPAHALMIGQNHKQTKKSFHTLVYQLERELLKQTAESVVVEVSKAFKERWLESINKENFKSMIQPTVYFVESKGVESYVMKRVGSEELTEEYLAKKDSQFIDKMNPFVV